MIIKVPLNVKNEDWIKHREFGISKMQKCKQSEELT